MKVSRPVPLGRLWITLGEIPPNTTGLAPLEGERTRKAVTAAETRPPGFAPDAYPSLPGMHNSHVRFAQCIRYR